MQLLGKTGEMIQIRDDLSRANASTEILQIQADDLKDLARRYKNLYELQLMAPEKVIYLQRDRIHTKDSIRTLTRVEYKDSMPVYTAHDSGQWHDIHVVAGPDSTSIRYQIFNEYITTHSKVSKWYARDQYKVTTVNLNPNTAHREMAAHSIQAKRAGRLGWLTLGLITGILIAK